MDREAKKELNIIKIKDIRKRYSLYLLFGYIWFITMNFGFTSRDSKMYTIKKNSVSIWEPNLSFLFLKPSLLFFAIQVITKPISMSLEIKVFQRISLLRTNSNFNFILKISKRNGKVSMITMITKEAKNGRAKTANNIIRRKQVWYEIQLNFN